MVHERTVGLPRIVKHWRRSGLIESVRRVRRWMEARKRVEWPVEAQYPWLCRGTGVARVAESVFMRCRRSKPVESGAVSGQK